VDCLPFYQHPLQSFQFISLRPIKNCFSFHWPSSFRSSVLLPFKYNLSTSTSCSSSLFCIFFVLHSNSPLHSLQVLGLSRSLATSSCSSLFCPLFWLLLSSHHHLFVDEFSLFIVAVKPSFSVGSKKLTSTFQIRSLTLSFTNVLFIPLYLLHMLLFFLLVR